MPGLPHPAILAVMTSVDPSARATKPAAAEAPKVERPVTMICPYLAAADGAWRSTTVAREHRCGAVAPPAPLAAEKQRRLCLTADYGICATYEAARAARPIASNRAPTLPRPLARTTPFVLDHGRIAIALPLRSDRSTAQAVLIGLLALAFAAIVLARVADGGSAAGVLASSSPNATVRATPNAPSAAPTARPVASKAPNPSGAPSKGGGASAAPVASGAVEGASTRTYSVKSGDTLIGIAARFGTTYQALIRLNGITNPSNLKIGQVLKIP